MKRHYQAIPSSPRSHKAGVTTRKHQTLDEAWADVLTHCAAGLAATAKRARRAC